MTLLEYLKQLHPFEWENFIKDTMILAEESAMFNGSVNSFANDEKGQTKADNLSFYFIGFKSAAPEFTLHTRIWASLRAQTLYKDRTWSDELLEGDQTDVPCRKPRGYLTSWWKYG